MDQKWEYAWGMFDEYGQIQAAIQYPPRSIQEMGEEGWEVVSVWYDNKINKARILLKRPKNKK
jgi:hypothetical protein